MFSQMSPDLLWIVETDKKMWHNFLFPGFSILFTSLGMLYLYHFAVGTQRVVTILKTFQESEQTYSLVDRSFVHAIQTSANPLSLPSGDESDAEEPIKMSAHVLGLGPVFRLVIGLCNTSAGKPSRNLMITFYCDGSLYK